MPATRAIDLNSDVGEGAGEDERIVPLITTANIACGAHAGDVDTMRATVALALRQGVAIGAHPGYRDPGNFGRVPVEMTRAALVDEVARQIDDLRRVARGEGAEVTHVKAHGALYNRGERDDAIGDAIAEAVASVDAALVVVATPRSAMLHAAERRGLRVAREGFVDRAYEPDGTLRSRRLPGALITAPDAAAAQALELAERGEIDTLCVHGDTPGAPAIAAAVREALARRGIDVRAFR